MLQIMVRGEKVGSDLSLILYYGILTWTYHSEIHISTHKYSKTAFTNWHFMSPSSVFITEKNHHPHRELHGREQNLEA